MMTKEEGGQYTKELVQKQFQHILSVGLKRETVRQELRAILKTPNLPDETLLNEISEIVMNETEHNRKIAPVTPTVNVVSSNTACSNTDALLVEMRKLSAKVSQLSSLQSDVERLKTELRQHQNSTVDPVRNNGGPSVNTDIADGGGGVGRENVANTGLIPAGRGGGGYRGRGGHQGGNRTPRTLECRKCHQTGMSPWNHCFFCCGEGHRQDQCPAKNETG